MKKLIFLILFLSLCVTNTVNAKNKMILKLKDGNVEIQLFDDVAPNHVKRIRTLVKNKAYDGVVFHRVIEGFPVIDVLNDSLAHEDTVCAGVTSHAFQNAPVKLLYSH